MAFVSPVEVFICLGWSIRLKRKDGRCKQVCCEGGVYYYKRSSLRPCGRVQEGCWYVVRVRKRHGKRLGSEGSCPTDVSISVFSGARTLRKHIESRTFAGTCRERFTQGAERIKQEARSLPYLFHIKKYICGETSLLAEQTLQLRRGVYSTNHTTIHSYLYTSEQQSRPRWPSIHRCECTSGNEKGLRRLCETAERYCGTWPSQKFSANEETNLESTCRRERYWTPQPENSVDTEFRRRI